MQILMEKKLGGLSPAADDAYSILSKIKTGTKISVDIKIQNSRSTAQHNYVFKLLNLLYEGQEYYPSLDHFRKAVLIHLGYCSRYPQNNGTEVVIADSMSFANMLPEAFSKLTDDILSFGEKIGYDKTQLDLEAKS